MEIDITRLFEANTWSLSGSIATHGADAGPQTWAASQAEAAERPILTSPEQLKALRDHVQGFGAWSRKEIAGWSDTDCNALFAQLIAGDKREAGIDDLALDDHDGWMTYEADAQAGKCSGNLYRGGDGRVYYYLGD